MKPKCDVYIWVRCRKQKLADMAAGIQHPVGFPVGVILYIQSYLQLCNCMTNKNVMLTFETLYLLLYLYRHFKIYIKQTLLFFAIK